MHVLARIGFILVGVHVGLSSLASLGRTFNTASASDSPIDPEFFFASIVFSLFLGVVPGALLILFSNQLASRIFLRNEPAPSPAAPEILTALVALLGVYFLIRGTAELVAALTIAGVFLGAGFDAILAEYSRTSLGALLRAVAGLFLFLYPGRIVRFITDRAAWDQATGGRAA